jgi:uncharacterized protein (DUF1015 family)
VPDFLPFRGIRYRARSDLTPVVAPPYDVIDEEERARLEAADPHNAVHLILPRGTASHDPYQAAAASLTEWRSEHILVTDPEPAFYAYEMRFTGARGETRRTIGIIGALELPAAGSRTVLAHERTLPAARTDRLALLQATRSNLDPIWCLSPAAGLTGLAEPTSVATATATDEQGVTHALYLIEDPDRRAAIRQAVAGAPLVLADGHHRFETACAYRAQHPAARGGGHIMTLVVELDETLLDIRAIHRLVHDAPPDLRARLAGALELQPAGPNTEAGVRQLLDTAADDRLVLADREGLARLALLPTAFNRVARDLPSELRGVDAARFEVVIQPQLGQATLSYRHDALAVASMVEKGAADAAVLLRPVTVDQIRAAAFAGLRMPEKTSFFWPKPRTGMVMRRLDD